MILFINCFKTFHISVPEMILGQKCFLRSRDVLKTQNIVKFQWFYDAGHNTYEIQLVFDINFYESLSEALLIFRNEWHNLCKYPTQFRIFLILRQIHGAQILKRDVFGKRLFETVFSVWTMIVPSLELAILLWHCLGLQ